MHKIKIITIAIAICTLSNSFAQSTTHKVLFLGNSYTAVNNLPMLLADLAKSTGDTIITDENTPGGHTLRGHSTNSVSLAKIRSTNWDFVVLQEQSQLPSFPEPDVEAMVYPFASALDSIIDANYACTKTVFYMTWGRKNGDAQNCAFWPPVCTYLGMDSLLALRYRKMANDNQALLSPVGLVWRYLRFNNPGIELYNPDESHPSLAGSYAAACAFYALLLKKDPTLITYNAGLTASDATAIKEAAKLIVYQKLEDLNWGYYSPTAMFKHQFNSQGSVKFENLSRYADRYLWEFGDGDTSIEVNPIHTYKAGGNYTVKLTAYKCNLEHVTDTTISIATTGLNKNNINEFKIYPNPTNGNVHILVPQSLLGESYQVIDVFGKTVITGKVASLTESITISAQPIGVYVLIMGNLTQRIIKHQ